MMLATLIKKEILDAILSFRFVIATLLCLILIPLGMYVNLKDYQRRLADFQEAQTLYVKQANRDISKDMQAEGFRPPSVLSIFSIGLEYFLPTKVITSPDGIFHTSTDRGIDNPQSMLFGKIDLLFNVSFVISLLALLFTFNAISGDKEQGTLRQLMANPVSRWKILTAKIFGNYLTLIVPLVFAVFVSLIQLSFSGIVPVFSADVIPFFLVMLVITLLFILAMFNIGILISALTHRSITSIIALLFVWTVLVLIIPKISPMIAEAIHPVRSQQVVNLQRTYVRQNLEAEADMTRRALYDKISLSLGMNAGSVSVPPRTPQEKALASAYDEQKVAIEGAYKRRIASALQRIDEEDNNNRSAQAAIATNLSRISPASCYTYIVSELAGTGMLEMNNFLVHAQQYQDEVSTSIYDKFIVQTYGGSGGGGATMINYAPGFDPGKTSVPVLAYRRPGIFSILAAEWVDVVLLVLFNIIFFAVSYFAFARYDVR